ncbi:MAG TPA: hypothetical protein PLV96_00615 [Methanoregulaceae archaeon]|nr:hypothetical protein [Methanoregulaceae archaeon]HPX73945.1 hypothetical protein [Methanoregulaceae archaeon]HQA79281.1 hypothetical protein [Methanoregulaceae archaeon]
MCTSPRCPNHCRTTTSGNRKGSQQMYRTYIRILDENRKRRSVPIGWWCPACHLFLDETR